jgi:hypothetical protein
MSAYEQADAICHFLRAHQQTLHRVLVTGCGFLDEPRVLGASLIRASRSVVGIPL